MILDPDNDKIKIRTEFGNAILYCKILNRTHIEITTPEYMENSDYILKIILTDNNKYLKSCQYKLSLHI